VFGYLHGREGIWGYFGSAAIKIPPYLPLTPAIPREHLEGMGFSGSEYAIL